jgi:DNA-binding SARP family transcriptional activator/tetratricopeptide (TPR) repeat protein
MSLDIRVLGPLEVIVDGSPVRVDTRKALAIVALLAVEGRPYARDELAAIFWPESDDESARGAFRRTLSVLRSALGERWLRADRATVSLATGADVTLDLALLDAAAARGDHEGLVEAAALARGPFLAGFSLRDSPDFDDWRATRAVSVERRVVDVLERLTAASEAAGDSGGAADAASRLVELDPLDEPARRRLMAILARSGDRAGAIRLYRTTVATLERELGVLPLAETTALYEAIRDERFAAPLGVAHAAHEPGTTPAPGAGADTAVGADAPTALPMVGRDAALARLVDAHATAAVDGRIATIRGEAGIGKSRLAEALAAAVAERGGRVLAARAFPGEGAIAYAPVAELLRAGLAQGGAVQRLGAMPDVVLAEVARLVALPPELAVRESPSFAESPAARARLLDAVTAVAATLVAGPVPGLLIVEDIQWADDASREALRYLARRLAGRPLLLVLTWRAEELDAAGDTFADAVDALAGTVSIPLDRLAPTDVAVLVAALGAGALGWDPTDLATESEGLPLYVVEALAAGPGVAGDAPRGVRALLHDRVARVGETATQVLAAAAVIGRTFDLGTVRAASGRSEDETIDALEELVRRAIVREVDRAGEPAFDFGHARLRDAAYEEIGLARRRLLHRRVAEVLRTGGRQDVARLAQIAGHELAAGRDAAAADAYREAGLLARAVFANREALEHLTAALALGHPDLVGLELAIGEARTALGDYAGAVAALEAAAAASDEAAVARIELRLGRVHARRGDATAAASHFDAALEGTPDPAERAALLVERGAVALRAGDLALASSLATDAGALAETVGDPRVDASIARLAGLVAHREGDAEAAATALSRSLAIAVSVGDDDPGPAIAARNALALVEAERGDRAAAIRLLEEALAECRRTGEPHLEAAVENNLADQLHAAGRTEEAMAHLKRAVALFAEVGGRPGELEPEIWKLVSW